LYRKYTQKSGEIKINKNIKLAVKEEVDWSIKYGL
jgi:hypothetical protein